MARKKRGNKERSTVDLLPEEWEYIEEMAAKFTVARGGKEKISNNQIFSWLIELGKDRLEEKLKAEQEK
ncbi:hypothetical protein H1164_18000 [Thermoactinomyces daqus]|jgi:hypothetical protein|uniref:Uncharacterized protein n=2 Tax=Thermoactinomyces daqus TaxID=1329516 RepID=A0A7W1XDL3_9BACL|nr:hypothetical protein [Thermoactinomyces daqus]MBA4544705.1 hypothetical protein [Thermoactinomyces daqus]